uniref:Uncharacterized protein n=1 Tax=Moniliophthora roreri TaxID=221103 RepID=A0A0W0FI73_MONRR
MFAQVCHLKCKFRWAVPASLPQLPAVCNWQALMDLATLWPRTNSPVLTLLAGILSSNYMLDGETYNPTYEADIDTDDLEAWSSMHESDAETKLYSFNNHLIKQEPVADPILLWTPSAGSISPDATPAPPSPLQTLTPLPTPLRKHLKSQVPFPHDAALVSGGTHLLSMRSSEGLIPLSMGLDATVIDYFEHPKAYGPKSRTAATKGKAKAKIVDPTPVEPSNSL